MSQMSQSERAMLYTMFSEISKSIQELNYTFEFNKEIVKLELVQKKSPICHTRHTLTKSELYNWYKNELLRFETNDESSASPLYDYASYYDIGFYIYVELLKQTINDTENSNPEFFI